jgi:hypothetical protein
MAYLTYFDLVESLIVSSYGGPQDAEQRDIRTAVQRAYSELTTIHEWSHYYQHGRIITQPQYQTGTVAYNSSTKQLTLTGGTWPTWAASGSVSIGRAIAKVDTRVSNTVLTLDSTLTFASTLAAGQAYVLYQTDYALPADFRNMDEPSNEFNWWSGLYLKPDEAMKLERVGNRSGRPWHWTVLKNPNGSGYILKLVGYPTAQETLDFTYRRYPRQIRYSGHEPMCRIADAAFVLATVQLSPDHPGLFSGSVIRAGTATAYPGDLASMNPYSFEAILGGYTIGDGADVIYDISPSYSYAGSTSGPGLNSLITDPIDVARHMEVALHSCASYWLDRIRGGKTEQSFSTYQRDLRLALEQDQLAPLSGRTREIWHDGGWRSPLKADEGA